MKKNKYMAVVTVSGYESAFTYTSQNMKTAKKELEKFFRVTQHKDIKVKLYRIRFDGNYYYDIKTGKRFMYEWKYWTNWRKIRKI